MDTFPDYDVLMSGTSTPLSTPYSSHRVSRTSFPSRRSSRIEKPRSSHNSPKVAERRRTTSAVKKYATLEDHWDMMFGTPSTEPQETRTSSRPVSWHPSSTRYSVITRSPDEESPPLLSSYTSNYNGSAMQPQSSNSGYNHSLPLHPSSQQSASSLASSQVTQTHSSPWDQMVPAPTVPTYPAVPYDPMPYQLQQGFQQSSSPAIPNPINDADFLPIQHPTPDEAKASPIPDNKSLKSGGKVLVGMGLYDPPDSRPTFVGSTLLSGTGKGLKLEETFQPPSEQDDEDPVEDVGSDEEEEEELPNPHDTQLSDTQTHDPVNLTGQSFLFEDEDSFTNDWWSQQFRYPGMVPNTSFDLRWEA